MSVTPQPQMPEGKRLYRVWIDETGDRGGGPKASPFFGVAAVVIRDEYMDQLRHAKREINRRLQRQPHHELHWSQNLKTHDKRYVAAEELARLPMCVSYAVVQKA